AEAGGGADERLQVVAGLPDAVVEERQPGGIAGEAIAPLDDEGRAGGDGVRHLRRPVVAVDDPAEAVAGVEVGGRGRTDRPAGDRETQRRALQAGQRLPG